MEKSNTNKSISLVKKMNPKLKLDSFPDIKNKTQKEYFK